MRARGRRTQQRAAERAERRERERAIEKHRRDERHRRKIKNQEESMGIFDNVFRGRSDRGEKASKAKTPPMAVQKPVYGDKKIVKAKNPKKGKK